jgi:hypothetical protein
MLRLVILFALLFTGCQTLSAQESTRQRNESQDKVRIVEDEDEVANCTLVDDVSVQTPFPFLTRTIPEFSSVGEEELKRELRYRTRLVGGNTLLRTGAQDGMTQGKAYDCE